MASRASLHEACYRGDLERARALLAAGADPNAPADPTEREWITCAGPSPRPLSCVAVADITESHLEIARVLLADGAVVDESVIRDHEVEMVGNELDRVLAQILRAGA